MKRFGLSGTTLKTMACVLMLIDHIGSRLLPEYAILRLIGRLAFPLFAFEIAQGCRYTRHKPKRFLTIFGFGAVWEALLIVYHGEWQGNILLTFSLSVLLIYALQAVKKQMCSGWSLRAVMAVVLFSIMVGGVYLLCERVHFEYRFFGIMVAPAVALFDYREGEAPRWMKPLDCLPVQLLMMAAMLFFQAYPNIGKTVQIYSLLAVVPLALYNGKAGSQRWKYAFYVFYPAHLIVIEAIRRWIE